MQSKSFNKLLFMQTIQKIIACTPNKNFNDEAYNKGVIIPANQLREIRENVDTINFDNALIKDILEKLVEILKTKLLSIDEINERIDELLLVSSLEVDKQTIGI